MTLVPLFGPAPVIDVVLVMTTLVLFVPLNVPGPNITSITVQFAAALDNAPCIPAESDTLTLNVHAPEPTAGAPAAGTAAGAIVADAFKYVVFT